MFGALAVAISSPIGARADSMDDRRAEALADLEAHHEGLAQSELDLRKQALAHCTKGSFDPKAMPEREDFFAPVNGSRAKAAAVHRVLNWNGETTSWSANGGIVNWMRDSVTSDCRLFRAELAFLKELRRRDIETGTTTDDMVPIQKHAAFDVLELARASVRSAYDGARDDPYLAMKVLAVYGHDNMSNHLRVTSKTSSKTVDEAATRCEYAILDAYAPAPTSTLYRDGAIRGLDYGADLVAQGRRIAEACKASCAPIPEGFDQSRCFDVCNDGHQDYQADYYHVVAANYLVCYAEAEASRSHALATVLNPFGAALRGAANSVFDSEYPVLARRYKKDRLREYYPDVAAGDKAPNWARVAYAGIDRLPAASKAADLCASLGLTCSTLDLNAAQAILDRNAFEVNLRERQHALGQSHAQGVCANGRASLDHPVCSGSAN